MKTKRVIKHNQSDVQSARGPVLYWLQETQRIHDNFALESAIRTANQYHLGLKVLFVLNPSFPEGNERHFHFMLQGITKLQHDLYALGAEFVIEIGDFKTILLKHLKQCAAFFYDKSYLSFLRQTKDIIKQASMQLDIPTFEGESNLIVPVEVTSQKSEYAARTIRPKLLKYSGNYLQEADIQPLDLKASKKPSDTLEDLMNKATPNTSVRKTNYFVGGEESALNHLSAFVQNQLYRYPQSNDPSLNLTSRLSPYLHFGQLSPRLVYETVMTKMDKHLEACEAFLEQLLVRRELAFNYVYYHDGYDTFEKMTDSWAYETMRIHKEDKRHHIYDKSDYLAFNTHDKYFNAAMKEMVETGFMHNYMRMYWGKKIIEWSQDYQTAYHTIISLNNAYFLDGRDPNSYAGVAWLFGKHDRAWQMREVFGKLRYMNENGLKRKFDIENYVKKMENL